VTEPDIFCSPNAAWVAYWSENVGRGGPVTNTYDKLPGRPDPADLVVEVPAFEDDRPQPEPAPPAAAPELVAATEFARSSNAPSTIRRTQMRAGAWIAGVPIGALVLVAIVQILLPR
jgi:hypothetical protein